MSYDSTVFAEIEWAPGALGGLTELPPAIAAPRVLSIGVLDGLSLAVGGRAVALNSRKARALLAYLVLENTSAVSRERLAGLFWGESSEPHARNSLRQALFEIRKALAPTGVAALRPGRDEIWLIRGAVETDLERLLGQIERGLVPEGLWRAVQGIDLLLAGYEDLSAEFNEWIGVARRIAQQRLVRTLERAYRDPGLRPLARRQLAEATLQIDPLHEAACRVVMTIAAEAGEVGVALRAYAALYEALGVQLDMEPSEPTQALVSAIKLGRLCRAMDS